MYPKPYYIIYYNADVGGVERKKGRQRGNVYVLGEDGGRAEQGTGQLLGDLATFCSYQNRFMCRKLLSTYMSHQR